MGALSGSLKNELMIEKVSSLWQKGVFVAFLNPSFPKGDFLHTASFRITPMCCIWNAYPGGGG